MITAQKRGEIRRDINPQFILNLLNKMIEIAGEVRVINMNESTPPLTTDLIDLFFYGILTEKMEDQ